MLIDILEEEELFFIYEQGYLQKREGYYIYYEKNLAMQEYMIYKREEEMRLTELKYHELEKENAAQEEAMQEAESAEEETAEEIEKVSENEQGLADEPQIKTQQWQDAQPIPKEPKTQAEEALETYRQMLLERQGKREERQNRRFLYTASSFFLVVLCVIGITTINNYRKMQEVEDVLNVMSGSKSQSSTSGKTDMVKNDAGGENPLVVESVESQIEPLDAVGQEAPQTPTGGKQTSGNAADSAGSEAAGNAADSAGRETAGNAEDGAGGEEAAGNTAAGTGREATGNPADSAGNGGSDNAVDVNGASGQSADEGSQEASPEHSEGNGQGETQETAAVQQVGEKKYYTVQAGDTLNSICLKLYQSKDKVQALKELNEIEDGDKILVGQKLLLP